MTEPYAGDVFECSTSVRKDGRTSIGTVHLIFVGGFPFAVLEWQDVPGGTAPAIVAKMDPQWLQSPLPAALQKTYTYQVTIRVPEDLFGNASANTP